MAVEWFDTEPGTDIGVHKEEGMLLIGVDPPDWVRVPDHPGMPGGPRKVLESTTKRCVRPGHDHSARHYLLEGPVSVCECLIDGLFQWYKNRS